MPTTPPPPPPPPPPATRDVRVRNAVTVGGLLVLTYLIYWRSISAISQNDFGKYNAKGDVRDADDADDAEEERKQAAKAK